MKLIFLEHIGDTGAVPFAAKRAVRWAVNTLLMICCLGLLLQPQSNGESVTAVAAVNSQVYLPYVTISRPTLQSPVIHMPFIDDNDSYSLLEGHYGELSVFWFGKVYKTENYSDVRIGYNRYNLVIDIATIDQQLWYDSSTPPTKDFKSWDAVSLFLSIPGANGQENLRFRLDAATAAGKWYWKDRGDYQAAYQWNGAKWSQINFPFRTDMYNQGYFNDPGEDSGWNISFRIPFSSLGLSDPPPNGSSLRMGIKVFDKDSSSGATTSNSWPEGLQELKESSYGQLTFGYPIFQRPANPVAGKVDIKQSTKVTVEDATVGGNSTCGYNGNNMWTEWGDRVYNQPPENVHAVVQNQKNIDDWTCFSRFYITFPLGQVPLGKVILSAKLTMRQFGGSDPTQAKPSYIQVLRVEQPWSPVTISWNNSPQAVENYPGIWVQPLVSEPAPPGVARTWDVAKPLSAVYGTDQPLRLALYSADRDMHSGKYFRSSETAAWGELYPPILTIEWGNP